MLKESDRVAAARRWECHMLVGDFEQAWRESDTIAAQGMAGPLELWDGLPFQAKHVIVRCLHGYGDAIQFLRYTRHLRETASRVIVETHPETVSLIQTLPCVDEVITWARPHNVRRSDWDQQIEVMELPRAFRTTLATVPRATPYFDISPRGTPRLPGNGKPKIGIVWAASAWNPARSIPYAELTPILELDGLSFYNFQRGPERFDLRGPIHDATQGAPDIIDTARDFLEIDLLITVDTMAAHLAGALNVPVWTLLPFQADWRWMLDREDSPWYPSMRLFRQPSRDSGWTPVIRRVRDELRRAFPCRPHTGVAIATFAGMSETNNTKALAVVTGASSGIGLELAKEFARRGFDLAIVADSPKIHQAAGEIRALGANVDAVQIDLSTYEGVEQFYSGIGRPVDAIAINAGVGVGGDFTRQTNLEAELKLIDLNVKSTVHLAKLALKDMLANNRGRVLFTASIASAAPGPFEAVYAASKAFVFSFSEALRNELRDTEITITALMPGATETNFFHRAGMDETKVGQSKKDDPAEVAREGVEALLSDKDRVVAGSFKNKLFAAAGRLAPEAAADMHRKEAEPINANG